MTTILLTAAEPSGDAMGAEVMEAIRAARPEARFVGAGGKAMRAVGLEGDLSTDRLAVMGPVDALAAWPRARTLTAKLGRLAASERPDAALLIDSWVFSQMVAERLRETSPRTHLVKLAAPQVWASRPGRAKVAAALFDHILCLLPFEPPWFEAEGGSASFIGNPNFQHAAQQLGPAGSFRSRYGLGLGPLLLLLPGSRTGEARRLLPIYGETRREVARRVGGLRTAVIAAPAVEALIRDELERWDGEVLLIPGAERFEAFAAGDAALAASGTVTSELALAGTPMVVTYKVGALTAAWARRVITSPYVTVLNVAAGEAVVPERLQGEAVPGQLAADLVRLLTEEEAAHRQKAAFRRIMPQLLGPRDPAAAAAEELLALEPFASDVLQYDGRNRL